MAVSPDKKKNLKKENASAGYRGIVDSNAGVRQRNLQGGGGDGRGEMTVNGIK